MLGSRPALSAVSSWFKQGFLDAVDGGPPITPATPDVQGSTGPRPHTDKAYEAGFAIGKAMIEDESVEPPRRLL